MRAVLVLLMLFGTAHAFEAPHLTIDSVRTDFFNNYVSLSWTIPEGTDYFVLYRNSVLLDTLYNTSFQDTIPTNWTWDMPDQKYNYQVIAQRRPYFNGHHYDISPIMYDHTGATIYAWNHGQAHLVRIESQAEQDFINSTFYGQEFLIDGVLHINDWFYQLWYGGYVPLTYFNWDEGEPRNPAQSSRIKLHSNGFWRAIAGYEEFFFIMEWDW